MNKSINELLGPLEAATRSGSWETVECVALEISRLARAERLSELEKIQEALGARRMSQEQNNQIQSDQNTKTPPEPFVSEIWPFG